MKYLAIILFIFYSNKIFSQFKVGENVKNIYSNSFFQVEAVNGNQFILTKDSGKMGIGTLTPSASIDVIGTLKITDGTQGAGKILVSDGNGLSSWKNPASISFGIQDSTTASNGLSMTGKDIVLGGTLKQATTITSSISNTLSIMGLQSGSITDSVLVSNPLNGVIRRLSISRFGNAIEPWYSSSTGTMALSNSDNIYQMGNVAIGTNSTIYPLNIKSSNNTSINIDNTSNDPNGVITLNVPGANSSACGTLNCSEFIWFKINNNLIGMVTPTNAGTGTQYLTSSDFRLKENIVDSRYSLDDLMKLRVVDYNYKTDSNKIVETGFIAQELHNIYPNAVNVGGDELNKNGLPLKPWMVDYSKLTPLLVQSVKDLNYQLQNQTLEIKNLNLLLNELQIEIKKLKEKLN